MVRKSWILIAGVIAVTVCVYAAEKGDMKAVLPAPVQAAVKALFPSATIEKSEMEEMEIKTYEVELKGVSVNVGADGTVISAETVETMDALPAAVAAAIKAQDAKAAKAEKEIKYAELKLVKLDTPVTTYEAKITKDGKEMEIKISADGKILEQKAAEKDEDEKDAEHEKK